MRLNFHGGLTGRCILVAIVATSSVACSRNFNAAKTYRFRIVDHDTGDGVVALPMCLPGGVRDYFTAPLPYERSERFSRDDGTFEITVRWPILEIVVRSNLADRHPWPYELARVRIDRRETLGVLVESPRQYGDDSDPEPLYRRTYPIDEKGVIVVPLFRKPAAGAEGSATQPMTGEVVPAGGDR